MSKWGFAPGADDTLQLDLGGDTQTLGLLGALGLQLQPAAGTGEVLAAAPGSSGSLDAHLRELHITEVGLTGLGQGLVVLSTVLRSLCVWLKPCQQGALHSENQVICIYARSRMAAGQGECCRRPARCMRCTRSAQHP